MARSFNAALPLIGLAMLLMEASITALGLLHPRVDQYYRAFYITHTSRCWMNAAREAEAQADLRGKEIAISHLTFNDACYLLASGWSDVEPWGVWSDGADAVLEIPVPPGAHYVSLTMRAYARRHDQIVRVSVDGVDQRTIAIPTGLEVTQVFVVPPGAGPVMTLAMHIKHPSAPQAFGTSSDTRKLGIGLIAIQWS